MASTAVFDADRELFKNRMKMEISWSSYFSSSTSLATLFGERLPREGPQTFCHNEGEEEEVLSEDSRIK